MTQPSQTKTRFAKAWARAEHRALYGCDRAACELDATTKRHDVLHQARSGVGRLVPGSARPGRPEPVISTFGSGSRLTIATEERGWFDWPILVAALVVFLVVAAMLPAIT